MPPFNVVPAQPKPLLTVTDEPAGEMVYDSSTQYFNEEEMVSEHGNTPLASDGSEVTDETEKEDEAQTPSQPQSASQPQPAAETPSQPQPAAETPSQPQPAAETPSQPQPAAETTETPSQLQPAAETTETLAQPQTQVETTDGDDGCSATEASAVTSAKDMSNESGEDSPVCMSK